MPIYEYKCNQCGEGFETIVFSSQDEANVRCPKCDSQEVERRISAFAVGNRSELNSIGASTSSGGCGSGGFS